MPTFYRLDKEGGFAVADTAEEVTAYAAPGSYNARLAATAPEWVAEAMLSIEELRRWQMPSLGETPEVRQQDAANMARLVEGQADGSTVTSPDDSSGPAIREGRQEARHDASAAIEAVREVFPGYDPNATGSALIARRFEERAAEAAKKEPQSDVDAVAASLAARLSEPRQEAAAKADPAGGVIFGSPVQMCTSFEVRHVVEWRGETWESDHNTTLEGAGERLGSIEAERAAPGYEDDYWGVYGRLPDGRAAHVEDYKTQEGAEQFRQELEAEKAAAEGQAAAPTSESQAEAPAAVTTWREAREIAQRNGYSLTKQQDSDEYRLAPRHLTGQAQEDRAYYANDPADAVGTMRAELRWQAAHERKVERVADGLGTATDVPAEAQALYYQGGDRAFIVCIPAAGPAFAYAHPGSDYAQKATDEPGLVAYAMAGDLRYTGKSFFILNDNSTMPMTDQDRAEAWQTFGPAIWRGLAKEVALGDSHQQDQQARPGVPGGWGVAEQDEGGPLEIPQAEQATMPDTSEGTAAVKIVYYDDAEHGFFVGIPGTGRIAHAYPDSMTGWEAGDAEGAARSVAADLIGWVSFRETDDGNRVGMTGHEQREAWGFLYAADKRGLATEITLGDSHQQNDQAAADSKPGLPVIGAPAESAEAEPARRRSTDTERTDPTSHVERDMARGFGQQIDREQSAIYHDASLTRPEQMAAAETNLRERIEAWDRPGMRAARAVDAGNVRAPAPLLDKLRAAQTPEVQEAVRDKLAKGLWAGDTHQDDHHISD